MSETETEEVKNDFNVYNKMSICHACLSSDRKLTLLQEYQDIFIKIIDNSNTVLPSSLYLCWECVAILKKIIVFKRKVENAQAILNYEHRNKLVPINLHSQSSLKIVKTDNNKNIIKIIHENAILETKSIEVEIKDIDLNIKDELDDAYFDNTFNSIDNNIDSDYTYLTNIKKEIDNAPLKIENVIKKNKNINKKITLKEHYRVILQEDKPKRELRKRIQIKPAELEFWWKKERDSEYYKSLTFKCDKCVCGWRTKNKLEIHNKKYHNMNVSYACDMCDTRHSSKLALTRHVIKHYYMEQCTICQYRCYNSSHMRWHVGLHRKSIQCVYCDACFHNTRLFHDHYRRLHTIFLCDLCGKRCKSKRMLEKHILRHQKNECKVCNKSFKSASILRYHVNLKHVVQSTEEAYCVQCDRQFINVNTYKRHLHSSAAHASERNAKVKKKFSCSECGNVYSRHVYMMNHYRHVHMKQSKHYCAECDRHFLNRTRYIDHMRYKHEGIAKAKNKICNICGRGFAVNRTLINHIRTHSGERPFECEYCNARFTQKHAMLSHVKYIHLKAKRRTCWQE